MQVKNFFIPSSHLMFFYRVYSFLYKYMWLRPVSYFLYYIVRIIFSSDIHPASNIGKNFKIRHHFGVVIGKNVIIGNNCIVYNGVSIGQRNICDSGMPEIGNNCVFYTGSVIVGKGIVMDETIVPANKVLVLK